MNVFKVNNDLWVETDSRENISRSESETQRISLKLRLEIWKCVTGKLIFRNRIGRRKIVKQYY